MLRNKNILRYVVQRNAVKGTVLSGPGIHGPERVGPRANDSVLVLGPGPVKFTSLF